MAEGERKNKIKETIQDGKFRILVLASGNGSNFQQIINGVEDGSIDANIIRLISDKEDAYALIRAETYSIPWTKVLSGGRKKMGSTQRQEFEQEILDVVLGDLPDLIVLAGWMMILSDDFVKTVNKSGTKIINLHPAYLSEKNDEYVTTVPSGYTIPVIRGANAIKDAHDRGLEMKVTGVTVHEVVSGDVDVGNIIVQREVPIYAGDTMDALENRVHKTEYDLLPGAIRRVIMDHKGQ